MVEIEGGVGVITVKLASVLLAIGNTLQHTSQTKRAMFASSHLQVCCNFLNECTGLLIACFHVR